MKTYGGGADVASEKDITSTEKLLDVIRGGADPETVKQEPPSERPPEKPPSRPAAVAQTTVKQKGLSVGIDIGYTQVRIIKVAPATGRGWRLLDYAAIPIPGDAVKGTPAFQSFLKETLNRYCGSERDTNLWAMMSGANVEVRNVSVPRVGRKELSNVVSWSAKKELDFDEKQTVFDYEIQGEVVESGVEKYSVLYYTVPRKDVQETRELFRAVGYPLSGLTIAPLAIMNIFSTDWIPAQDRAVASLYIGRGWSRIDIYSSGKLVMTRGIKAGLNSMVESLVDEYPGWRRKAEAGSREIAMPESDETTSGLEEEAHRLPQEMAMEHAQRLLQSLSPESKSEDSLARDYGLDRQTIFQLIEPAIERLVRQVERTFEHYAINLGRESISAIYVSMAMNTYSPMVDYIGAQLDIPSDILDPLFPDHAWVGRATAGLTLSERSAFVPALGTALSHPSRSLNLLFTQVEKEQSRRYRVANYAVLGVLALLFVTGLGWYAWLANERSDRKAQVASIEQRLASEIEITEAMLVKMTADLKAQRQEVMETKERYLAAALFGEVSAITPEVIRLMSVRAELGTAFRDGRTAAAVRTARSAMIDGFVTGNADSPVDSLEADLIAYVMSLQGSPLFERVVINAKNSETLGGRTVLRFTLTASMKGASL